MGPEFRFGWCDLVYLPLRAVGKERWENGCEQEQGVMSVSRVSGVPSG